MGFYNNVGRVGSVSEFLTSLRMNEKGKANPSESSSLSTVCEKKPLKSNLNPKPLVQLLVSKASRIVHSFGHYKNWAITSRIRKMAYEITEQKKIGIGFIGFGIFFTFLGVLLFFDRGLIALGNLFALSGVALLLGWLSTWKLFTRRQNYKGSVSFLVGLFLIFVRWPIVGIVMEIYGSIVLFRGFWPSVRAFLYQIPVVGWFLQYPFLLLDRLRRSFG